MLGLLLKRYAPHDTYTVWKVGDAVRIDGTLRGLDQTKASIIPEWRRGPFSVVWRDAACTMRSSDGGGGGEDGCGGCSTSEGLASSTSATASPGLSSARTAASAQPGPPRPSLLAVPETAPSAGTPHSKAVTWLIDRDRNSFVDLTAEKKQRRRSIEDEVWMNNCLGGPKVGVW